MLDAKDYKIEECGSEIRRFYRFNGTTPKGETVLAEISECYPFSAKGWGKNDLPTLWAKAGYTKEVLPNYLCLHTYVTDKDGHSYMDYNPQDRIAWDGKRRVIDFEWMLTVSQENIERLLSEVVRRANAGEPQKTECILSVLQPKLSRL